MGSVRETFDEWAGNGRAEKMEREHERAVVRCLESTVMRPPRRFLDVGCGNGWLVRRIAADPRCRVAIGIDASLKMVQRARLLSTSQKERYVATCVESWAYQGRFDLVFSMEALYYADSVSGALDAIFALMAPGSMLICGTDFYAENKATRWWASEMGITMHLMSRAGWVAAFRRAGLRATSRMIKDKSSTKKWRREKGTLFVTGTKPPES